MNVSTRTALVPGVDDAPPNLFLPEARCQAHPHPMAHELPTAPKIPCPECFMEKRLVHLTGMHGEELEAWIEGGRVIVATPSASWRLRVLCWHVHEAQPYWRKGHGWRATPIGEAEGDALVWERLEAPISEG